MQWGGSPGTPSGAAGGPPHWKRTRSNSMHHERPGRGSKRAPTLTHAQVARWDKFDRNIFCVRHDQGMGLAGAHAEHTERETQLTRINVCFWTFAVACAFSERTELSFCRFPQIFNNFLLNSQRPATALRITQHSNVGAIFCAPFVHHSLGCLGGSATESERKRTPTARTGKQMWVNDVFLEMVPFLFSVPGQYSRAGI